MNQATIDNNTDWQAFDYEMMALALRLAKKAEYTARPNPMVGCVLVKNEQIIGEGWHQKAGQPHAEINALTSAGDDAKGATCYVTLEPCAHFGRTGPCAVALVKAGVSKVIAAMLDPNPKVAGKGFDILRAAGIQVEYGLLEAEAERLNRGFISRMSRSRPWVTCKLAMSLDGRTALADGASKWITGSAARADVQKLRARQDAIITGIGTLLADNPSLTVREKDSHPELEPWFANAAAIGFTQPARILFDRQGRADKNSKLFNDSSQVIWVSETDVSEKDDSENNGQPESASHVEAMDYPDSLLSFLQNLAAREFNNVLVEAGHRLAGAFLKEGLIDELVVYMAPKLMGTEAMGLMDIQVESMALTPELKLLDVRALGDNIKLVYKPEPTRKT